MPTLPPAGRIEAVVFDLGGVLLTPVTRTMAVLADRLGTSVEVLRQVMMGPTELSGDHPWHRIERGEITLDELQLSLTVLAAAEGIAFTGTEMDEVLAHGAFAVRAEMLDRVRSLRAAGYRTALLTNSIREFRPTLEQIVPVALFDALIDSSEVGCRKPDAAIYWLTLAALGIEEPSGAVFLDDFEWNLVGAAAVGLRTIHVVDPVIALVELDALLARAGGAPDTGPASPP